MIRRHPTADEVIFAVLDSTGVPLDQFDSTNRHAYTVQARHLAVFLLREMTVYSYPDIARAMRPLRGHADKEGRSTMHTSAIGAHRSWRPSRC